MMESSGPFYQTDESVKQYLELSEGIDGRSLIERLHHFLPENSSVLELGMGPGKDLEILNQYYEAVGSDFSELFLNRFREINPNIPLMKLDAVTLDTDNRFDAIYTNKVLHHLKPDEIRKSLKNQTKLLNSDGLICHSFWKGKGVEEIMGLTFHNYESEDLEELITPYFQTLSMEEYSEMGKVDSILVIARKKAEE